MFLVVTGVVNRSRGQVVERRESCSNTLVVDTMEQLVAGESPVVVGFLGKRCGRDTFDVVGMAGYDDVCSKHLVDFTVQVDFLGRCQAALVNLFGQRGVRGYVKTEYGTGDGMDFADG